MSWPIRFLPEARDEFDAAADWYKRQQTGLGADFIARVREVLQRIAAHPGLHATVYQDVRQAGVRQFPYVVLDREEAGEVVIISVFHSARDPSTWQSRV